MLVCEFASSKHRQISGFILQFPSVSILDNSGMALVAVSSVFACATPPNVVYVEIRGTARSPWLARTLRSRPTSAKDLLLVENQCDTPDALDPPLCLGCSWRVHVVTPLQHGERKTATGRSNSWKLHFASLRTEPHIVASSSNINFSKELYSVFVLEIK